MAANILDEIVAHKREEIAAAKAAKTLEEIKAGAAAAPRAGRRPFRKLFDRAKSGVFIAEIKPKSPSAGKLIMHSPLEIADLYAKSEADAISVLTDEKYFGGSLDLLKEVRARVPQAILRKDFIVDEYQVYETLLSGADAFLLIANILSTDELLKLLTLGSELGLDHLVEVHDEGDAEKALAAGAELIGINNRDLKTLTVSLETTKRLMGMFPRDMAVVSESGFESAGDVRAVRALGIRGILVGTSILRSLDPIEMIAELKHAL